jgi:hypothetical protein
MRRNGREHPEGKLFRSDSGGVKHEDRPRAHLGPKA